MKSILKIPTFSIGTTARWLHFENVLNNIPCGYTISFGFVIEQKAVIENVCYRFNIWENHVHQMPNAFGIV
jgi:hypothetical protein